MAAAEATEAVALWLPSDSEDNTYRILLVGKTGSGKSKTGNTLLGEEKFKTKLGMASETYECQLEQIRNASYTMEVTDCPGLFDTKTPNKVVLGQILKAVGSMHPGPTAVLYTIKIGDRYTEEEYLTFQLLKNAFGPEIVRYIIIGFTHGDKLVEKGMTIDKYVNDALKEEQKFKTVYEQCGERYVEFNNTPKGPKGQQIEIFLTKINDMVKPYKHRTFRCDKFEIIDIGIEVEVRRRLLAGKEQELHKKGQDTNLSKVENELEQSQSEGNERAEAEPKESDESIPLTNATNTELERPPVSDDIQSQTAEADTSEQDGNKPPRDILLDFDEETIQRIRFELRQEIALGGEFFEYYRLNFVDAGIVYGSAATGMLLGLFGGPVGAVIGSAIGLFTGSLCVNAKYIIKRSQALREHMRQLEADWNMKLHTSNAESSAE